ncbi:squalene synthase isoform X1 [Anolis carolinensis]|uniref:squalene synthase isoform X1 n=2 Tax=Anolis carolinensis TaxID=28377 RepID=UPI002F2B45B8
MTRKKTMEMLKTWLRHPKELYNLVWFKMGGYKTMMPKMDQDSLSESLCLCYRYVNQSSQSYSAIIHMLDGKLRHVVCILYLVLLALDIVEDDMTISLETKIPILHNFHSFLNQPDWRFMGSNDKNKHVLEDFPTISLEFRNLAKVYQDVIADVCRKVGLGMAEFLEKKVESEKDWDKYCHYASGQLGIGLSQLFSVSKLEDLTVGQDIELANTMGVFLHKIDIIRDYHEDLLAGREFWPQEVWSKYANTMSDLARPENVNKAIQCLNELITNALHHIPDVLTYLSRLKNQSVFNFCAIPQVRAIVILAACYNNPQVFQGPVKIRKGQDVSLMMDATNLQAVKAIVYQYMEEIYRKIPSTDPSSSRTQQIVTSVCSLCSPRRTIVPQTHYYAIYMSCVMVLAVLAWQYLNMVSKGADEDIYIAEN